MFTYPFMYRRPASLSEALTLFRGFEDATYLAGGHTLLPAMKARLAGPQVLIDLRHVPELRGIDASEAVISVRAGMTHEEVATCPDIIGKIPALAGLAGLIGDVHVRHMGTIGGSVANNDPAADYPCAVLGLDATIRTDRRVLSAEEYFTGLYATALEAGEIVSEISFEIPEQAAYAKFRNPASHYAMAGVFVARLKGGDVRVAVTGAGNDGVFRWRAAEEALLSDWSKAAIQGLFPDEDEMLQDLHGSAAYRANLVSVMACRAVENSGQVLVEG